jgi:hypothetical protein
MRAAACARHNATGVLRFASSILASLMKLVQLTERPLGAHGSHSMRTDFGYRGGSSRLFGRIALAACTLAPNVAAADVALVPRLADAPSLSGTGSFGFYGIVLDGSGARTLLSVGDTGEGNTFDAEIVALGPFADGVLKRSAPLLPFYSRTRAVAISNFPQPLLVTLGDHSDDNFMLSSGIDVYGGSPLVHLFSRSVTGYNAFNAVTLTRVASA